MKAAAVLLGLVGIGVIVTVVMLNQKPKFAIGDEILFQDATYMVIEITNGDDGLYYGLSAGTSIEYYRVSVVDKTAIKI